MPSGHRHRRTGGVSRREGARRGLALSIALLTAFPFPAVAPAATPEGSGFTAAVEPPRPSPELDLAPVTPISREEEDDDGTFDPGVQSPYVDQTPLCHYLERGIDDLAPGKRDLYALTPPGVATLADIDHITLGLDLPYTQCDDNPNSIPCTDNDNSTSWCVKKVELFVGNKKLYEESDEDCTRNVGAGKGGMRTITRQQLRSHELWGFEVDELLGLLSYRKPGSTGFDLEPPGVTFSGGYLSLVLEGVVGDFLARGNKGCSNDTYCGNRRGRVSAQDDVPGPLMEFMRASKVDCDLGGCASETSRKSSPYVEVRGKGSDRLEVDVDVEIVNSTADGDDCLDGKCGNIEAYMGRGSLELDLGFPCIESAEIDVADVGTRTVPYCDGDLHSPCWKKTGIQPGSKQGVVQCNDSKDAPSCGKSATLIASKFDQSIAVAGSPTFDAEGGFLFGLLDFACWLTGPLGIAAGCSSDDVATRLLTENIDTSLFGAELFKGLDGCPAVGVKADGTVNFDFRELDSCPDGAKNPECADELTGGPGGGQAPAPGGRGPGGLVNPDLGPGGSPPGDLANPAPAATPGSFVGNGGTGEVPGTLVFAVPSGNGAPALPVPGGLKGPTPATGARLKPYEVDDLLVLFCAANAACVDPGFDLAGTLAQLSPAQLEALATGGLDALDPVVAEALLADDAFMGECVGTESQNETAKQFALAAWLAEVAANQSTCETSAPNVEDLYPVPGLVLAITTAGGGVTDQYAFANFRKDDLPGDIPEGTRELYGCTHINDVYLPPANVPQCVDGLDENGEPCGGRVGGPCMEIGDIEPQPEVYEDEAHPNGDWSALTRCGIDQDSSRQMVCVREQFNGAGGGDAGICRICGVPGDESPTDFTMQGCPIELGGDGTDCPQDYVAGADGRCWRIDTGPPAWECQADCGAVYGDSGYCFHSGSWRSFWQDNDPDVDQAIAAAQATGDYYTEAICADWIGCDELGASCAAQGQACSNDQCATECTNSGNCHPQSGFPLRYPSGFVCTPENTCQLP